MLSFRSEKTMKNKDVHVCMWCQHTSVIKQDEVDGMRQEKTLNLFQR